MELFLGVKEQGEVGIGGCEHGGAGGGVVEGGQGYHLACHILVDLFLEFGNWKLLDDIFSSFMFHVQSSMC